MRWGPILSLLLTLSLGANPPSAKPCDDCLPGVSNFARLDDLLWRGSQPTAAGFQALEQAGVKTVVSFRHDHDDLPLLKGTRLRYLRIPSLAFHPEEDHLVQFLKVLADPRNRPVFIHCAQGRDRTGYNAAAYRMVMQGWNADQALREMHAFHFNKVWMGNPGFLRRLQVDRIQEQVAAAPPPTLLQAEP